MAVWMVEDPELVWAGIRSDGMSVRKPEGMQGVMDPIELWIKIKLNEGKE